MEFVGCGYRLSPLKPARRAAPRNTKPMQVVRLAGRPGIDFLAGLRSSPLRHIGPPNGLVTVRALLSVVLHWISFLPEARRIRERSDLLIVQKSFCSFCELR
jgi:hypothetical protein